MDEHIFTILKVTEMWRTGFAWLLVTTYIIIRYQKRLDLKGSAWGTFLTGIVMLGLAIDTAFRSDYHRKNILTRQVVMVVWSSLQVVPPLSCFAQRTVSLFPDCFVCR